MSVHIATEQLHAVSSYTDSDPMQTTSEKPEVRKECIGGWLTPICVPGLWEPEFWLVLGGQIFILHDLFSVPTLDSTTST